jgi:hypothetical protein
MKTFSYVGTMNHPFVKQVISGCYETFCTFVYLLVLTIRGVRIRLAYYIETVAGEDACECENEIGN